MAGLGMPMGGPMMNRVPSAPGAGPSNPNVPPLGGGPSQGHGAGNVMSGLGTSPIPHWHLNLQYKPLQASQHAPSQGMPQQQQPFF